MVESPDILYQISLHIVFVIFTERRLYSVQALDVAAGVMLWVINWVSHFALSSLALRGCCEGKTGGIQLPTRFSRIFLSRHG